ncbi:hydroxyacid dehydrogenase [Schlegelella sp. S2-27]|uniref:Hydroxyacid dehydrogenase n=1 Tax=Caldimonas mangrovi TaxID=2944811 RepID=A0ABT0YJE0_9BURK|nr:NAD(P)-dependent oxidoreductase [Caldimonas mangrovi]MCM5678835.1 hydroxyacid dehydrogenase [Caldimonas mangrovi]
MNHPPRIVVTNRIHDEVRARLEALGSVEMNTGLEPWSAGELAVRLRGASAMMGFMTDRVDDALLAEAADLRIVACALKGYDAYDVDACSRRGVWLSIVPDLLTEPTAELALGLAIGLGRHLRAGDEYVRRTHYAGWRAHLYGTGLHGATVAMVGLGRVGAAIVERLRGFGCTRILGVDPQVRHPAAQPAALHEAMAVAQLVFLAVPLRPDTHHLVDAERLARAAAGQQLVNVGRGSVVDEQAVAAALHSGRLGGYAADVFGCEDWGLPERPARIPTALLDAPNTLFTPHLGSAVHGVRLAIEHRAADNIVAALTGGVPADALNHPESALA